MSILSFPHRGEGGNSKWRGNCSPLVYQELFQRLQPTFFVDPMVGSGTSVEVAKSMSIDAIGLDLHSGFNALRMSILDAAQGRPADLCVSHPPYGGMVIYSGQVWGTEPHHDDLSRCASDEEFHENLHQVLLNQRDATTPGGYYGTIIGDWRRNGAYTSYQAECIARMPAGELAAVIIKTQHNTMSERKAYGRMKLPFIMHEYILLWCKPKAVMSMLSTLSLLANQQSRRLRSTWKVVVKNTMSSLGGEATLADIYQKIEESAPEKLASNPNWKAKIRQTLQSYQDFEPVDRGIWKMAA